jgi:hypothetical protein
LDPQFPKVSSATFSLPFTHLMFPPLSLGSHSVSLLWAVEFPCACPRAGLYISWLGFLGQHKYFEGRSPCLAYLCP